MGKKKEIPEEITVEVKPSEVKFDKDDFLNSKQFSPIQKDFLKALLTDGKKYTLAEAHALVSKKMKEAVK